MREKDKTRQEINSVKDYSLRDRSRCAGHAGAIKEGAVKSVRIKASGGGIVGMAPNKISFYPVKHLLDFIFQYK